MTEAAALMGRSRFADFLASLATFLEAPQPDDAATAAGVAELLRRLLRHDDWLDEAYAAPDPDSYRQYLLYCDPRRRFSVVSFVWGPGHETPVHDHTTWGVVGVLRGAEVSQSFEYLRGELIPGEAVRLEPGDIALLSPAFGDIHRVRNAFDDRPSISIHIYGGDIGAIERHTFSAEGGTKTFVSGYSNAALPNVWGSR